MKTLFIIASFTAPQTVGITPSSMLWLIPLAAAIAIVYKVTKLETITLETFIKEAGALLGSIVIFMGITALVLYILACVFTS